MTERRLSHDYNRWDSPSEDLIRQAVKSGLIVPDANVLLSLYEVAPASRDEILDLMERVAGRLWIPHQVALEYSKNRHRVVIQRDQRISNARKSAQKASDTAAGILGSVIDEIVRINERNRSVEPWSPESVGIDTKTLRQKIRELLDPALSELERLRAEHDIAPSDVSENDPVFDRLDTLSAGRIGAPLDRETRRRVVEEAQHHRYPNDIPPGSADVSKKTGLAAAGDYLLWWETLRKAAEATTPEHIVLVTADAKSDWWVLKEGKPLHPRPELAQEVLDESGRQLVVLSTSDFAAVAANALGAPLSARTVDDLKHASAALSNDATRPAFPRDTLTQMYPEERLLVNLAAAFRRLGFLYRDDTERFTGALSTEQFGNPEWVTVEIDGSGRHFTRSEVDRFRLLAVGEPSGTSISFDDLPRRAILVSVGGFTEPDGPLSSDDRVYLMGPIEVGQLLAGVASSAVLEWLLSGIPGMTDLDP